jgi:hypothetical protein
MEESMAISRRMGSAVRWGHVARRERAAWGAVVVPPETKALIASKNALQIKALVEEGGAWLAFVGFSVACWVVLAVAIGFV